MPLQNELNEKQKRFGDEYIIDLNATAAYIRAGYSEKGASVSAFKLLANTNLQKYIQEQRQVLQEATGVTKERVIKELAKIGFSNIKDFLKADNEVVDLSELDEDILAPVESIKKIVTDFEGGQKTSVQFKLYDKISALEKLGRHLGIFEIDNSQRKAAISVTIDD